MATSPFHTLGTVQIPRGLIWIDEFDWMAVAQSQEYGITGALIVDQAMRQAGRPITLQGSDNHGWIRRDVLAQVWELSQQLGGVFPLVLADGRSFEVRFAAEQPLTATAITRAELPPDALPHIATIRLNTV
ncbi:MAG: hypothetical protein EOP24_26760 [Hyphomicrobiales bacterium]|nr:MAG: hypothetical protein EOP24_26760 [Hyphomicrobiales bacterium]